MSKSTRQKKSESTPSKVVTSLDEINGICARPLKVRFQYAGVTMELETRHLTPKESELLKLQLDEAMPPIIKGKTEAEDRFDFGNIEYQRKRTRIERECRAQAIFWATKAFQEKRPDLVEGMYNPAYRERIVDFVQSMLTEAIHEIIYEAIVNPEVSVPELVNFT
mgnify:CR=1 FL=1